MHTLQEADDPNQAGEGVTVYDETADDISAVYYGSSPIIVSTLFSAGIGPVYENDTDGLRGFPYRGEEGLTELDVYSNDEYKGRWMEYRRRALIRTMGSEEYVLEDITSTTSFKSIDEYLEHMGAKT